MLEYRIYVSAAVSAGAWTLIAFTASNIQTHHATANTVETVTHSGWMTQVLAMFLAAVSFLALFATYFGHYPPTEQPHDDHERY